MELFFLYFFLGFILLILVLLQTFFYKHRSLSSSTKLPPGRMGWPIFGETFQYLSTGFKGHPEKFVIDRMKKYSQECFKTNILGQYTAILCSSAGNKFLFSNENKLVKTWWPESVNKLFPSNLQTNSNEEGKNLRKLLPQFLKVEALQRYISVMDTISHTHFAHEWENKEEVLVFPLAKKYTFWLACRLFLSVEDPKYIARFADPFHLMAAGIFSIPIDFPGTAYSKAIKAAKVIRNDLRLIIKQRKIDLAEKKATPTQDILSHMLTTSDENGKYMTEEDIADKIIALLIGGHDTTSVVITAIVKYLAELPHVYNAVYEEQMAIAKSKGLRELLSYEDIQKMKYSWNVACEALRLVPPVQGAFREAMTDIMYSGFTIPKGWKFYWSAYATHLNPQYFADPVKFDPTRFEGSGPAPYTYVPFGGGPRMCPGKEYARFEILAFMHNLVKRFRWEKVYPDENFKAVPLPMPTKGLPIRLIPHTTIE